LEKNYEALKKENNIDFLVFNPKKVPKLEVVIEKKKKINKNKIRKELLRKVRDTALMLSNINIIIKVSNNSELNLIRNKKKNISISYLETLNPEIFPWYNIKIANLTGFEVYQVYKEFVPNELIYAQLIQKNKNGLRLKKAKPVLTPIVLPPDYEFCYCKKFTQDVNLVGKIFIYLACDNWGNVEEGEINNCKSIFGWFHHYCIDSLKNFTTEEINDENFKWTCPECIKFEKNASENNKN
jgi:hypothetical protein